MYLALAEVFAVLIFCSSPFFLNTFVTLFYVAVRIPCVITFLAFFRVCVVEQFRVSRNGAYHVTRQLLRVPQQRSDVTLIQAESVGPTFRSPISSWTSAVKDGAISSLADAA